MTAQKRIASKRFPGVFHRESSRKVDGKPDKLWGFHFYDVTGRQVFEMVGRASEGVTEAYTHKQRVAKLNAIHRGDIPSDPLAPPATLDTVYRAFLEWAKTEGKHTVPDESRYGNHLGPKFGAFPLGAITDKALTKHKAELLKKLSPGTAKHVFALLRRIINYGLRKKMWTGENPIGPQSDFTLPIPQNKGERFLTREEATALLLELEKRSMMVHDMALLSLRTGLRATEIFNLRGKDVDRSSNTLHIRAKGGRRQPVYADDGIIAMLLSYKRRPQELIFRKENGDKLDAIYDVFGRACDACRLNDGVTDRRNKVWFHVLRHTYISWWAQSGEVSLQELKDLARHDRIESTMRYAHLIPADLRRKQQELGMRIFNQPSTS